MRRSIRVERRLDAPPDAVFKIIADHARYDRFDGIRRSELVEPGHPAPNGLGAVRRVWLGPFRFEEEITAFEPPRRLDYLIRDVRTLPFHHEGGSIRLAPDGASTHAVGHPRSKCQSHSSGARSTGSSRSGSSEASDTCLSEAPTFRLRRRPRASRAARARGPRPLTQEREHSSLRTSGVERSRVRHERHRAARTLQGRMEELPE
jgi:hypothetical protein